MARNLHAEATLNAALGQIAEHWSPTDGQREGLQALIDRYGLPPHQAIYFFLRRSRELSYREVGMLVGRHWTSVRRAIERAEERLRLAGFPLSQLGPLRNTAPTVIYVDPGKLDALNHGRS